MLLWLHFANKLFITKIFLISIYKRKFIAKNVFDQYL